MAETGHVSLAVLAGTVDELVSHTSRDGGESVDPPLYESIVEHLAPLHSRRRPWPPQRNEGCWCGSGLKYKKCCLLRLRT